MSNNDNKDIIIEPGRTEKNYWRDIWRYRELFYFLAWRDILVRYKQTVFGVAWSVIRPVLTMLVFTIIFGKIAKLPSGNVPYPIMVFTALLPWQFFASALQDSSNSLLGNAPMISKVYFPRMIIPASSIIVAIVDFLVSFVLLAVLMIWYKFVPNYKIIYIPLFLSMALILAFGVGLLIASLSVKYRDFKYIIPVLISFGLYISPVGFSSDVVPAKWRLLYSINPMVGVIDGFRWCILGEGIQFYLVGFIISIVIIFLFLFIGIWYFRKTEKTFADSI